MEVLNERAVADELAIRELTARFSDAVNRRAPKDLGALFAPDGAWVVPGVPDRVGPQAVAESLELLLPGFEFLAQLLHSGWVEVDGDKGRARWYLSEFGRRTQGGGSQIVGVYHDDLVRLPEGWRFARRRFDLLYLGTVEAPGKIYPFKEVW